MQYQSKFKNCNTKVNMANFRTHYKPILRLKIFKKLINLLVQFRILHVLTVSKCNIIFVSLTGKWNRQNTELPSYWKQVDFYALSWIYKLWNLLEDLQVANNNNQIVVAAVVGTKQSEKDLLLLRPLMKLAYIPWIFHPLIKVSEQKNIIIS